MSKRLIGRTIDTYRIDALLGEGGMGAVYRAHDLNLDRTVALKVTKESLAKRSEFRRRFLQEAQAAAKLDHPSIIKVHSFGSDQGILFMVTEYIDGGNLAAYLKDIGPNQTFDLGESVYLLAQVADGLAYAHRRHVIHRDIKPDNIMLKRLDQPDRPDAPPLRAVVTDFGLAKLQHSDVVTQTGTFLGTMAYMSPEQCLGKTLDGRSDIYSVGIVLYELATGRRPFKIQSPSEAVAKHVYEVPPRPEVVRPGLSAEVVAILARSLAKNPASRFATAAEMAAELRTAGKRLSSVAAATTIAETELDGQTLSFVTRLTSMSRVAQPSRLGSDIEAIDVDQLIVSQKGKTPQTFSLQNHTVTLGRSSSNTIQLPYESVSARHARLDRAEQGWAVTDLNSTNGTFLDSSRLLPDVAEAWNPQQTLRIGPYSIHWRPAQTTGTVATAAVSASLMSTTAQAEAHALTTTGQVSLTMQPADAAVEAGQSIQLQAELLNQGVTVEHYAITVENIPDDWIQIAQSKVPLMPGERTSVPLVFRPPRDSSSKAGEHEFQLTVRSISDAAEVASIPGKLEILPFEQFTFDAHPTVLRHGRSSHLVIHNEGNQATQFVVSGRDPADALYFRGLETSMSIPEGGKQEIAVPIGGHQRKWLGGSETHPYTLEVVAPSGAKMDKNGQVKVPPILPLWLLPMFLLLMVLCLAAGGFAWLNDREAKNASATSEAIALVETATAMALTDSDGDGLPDVVEGASSSCTLPDKKDTDADGLTDKEELDGWQTKDGFFTSNPCEAHSDDDGLEDGQEREFGTNPREIDSDGDSLSDGKEVLEVGSIPTNPDTDGDGLPDGVDPDPGNRPTDTPTPTSTVTPSRTPTSTPTNTQTPTPFPPTNTPTPTATQTPTATPEPVSSLDEGATPNYGSLTLSNGFEPDPKEINVSSGGSVNIEEYLASGRCVGYAGPNPDFQLNWSGGGFLRFYFNAVRPYPNASVIVQQPNGDWFCSDPKLERAWFDFADAMTGTYRIWISSHSPDTSVPGVLAITQYNIRF